MQPPAESLSSDQVDLHRWRTNHLDALERAIHESRDHLVPWFPWAADTGRQQTADFLARMRRKWETGEAYGYAITSHAEVIGTCVLMRRIGAGGLEIGYWLHPARTGRGLVTMACTALTAQGFGLPGIDRIEIRHDAANHASGAVARRLGFTEVERVPAPEGPIAPAESGIDVIWRMTSDQWRTRPTLTFVRHTDGLRHRFERDGEHDGRPAYRRTDGNVWCVWSAAEGWHCRIADGRVTAHPADGRADGPLPPAAVWRSFKDDRSYLYDLRTEPGPFRA